MQHLGLPNNMATTADIPMPLPNVTPVQEPVWIRLPKDCETCRHFGFTRATYKELIAAGRVRSISLRSRPGALRGVRIILYQSVKDYLASCAPETYIHPE